MKVTISRIDKSLPLPLYQTEGAVAFDLYAREDATIEPGKLGRVPTNIVVETPPGYMLLLASRSSTPGRKGLLFSNGIGIIDQDYAGPEDEIQVQFYNITDAPVTIDKGERVAQALFIKIDKAEWHEGELARAASRGGFGTSGTHI